jgi:uracil-DNA glycosylase family 4
MGNAEELEAVKERILAASLPLQSTAQNLVFGKGNPEAPILFIGEAPGAKEDEQGIPFVGAAGKQLDRLLASIGLGIDDVYIANILKYRPPENRDPNPEEIAAHTPYLIEQIRAIQPRIVCTLGNYSTKFVLGGMSVSGMKKVPGVSQLHGQSREVVFDGDVFTVVPLFHPAAMLYNPKVRPLLEADFLKMGEMLSAQGIERKREKQASLEEF